MQKSEHDDDEEEPADDDEQEEVKSDAEDVKESGVTEVSTDAEENDVAATKEGTS